MPKASPQHGSSPSYCKEKSQGRGFDSKKMGPGFSPHFHRHPLTHMASPAARLRLK